MNLLIVSILTLIINIPFGIWRAKNKSFSFQWIAAIHIPVFFVVGLRLLFEIGFLFYTYPIIISTYFLGQLAGKKIYDLRINKDIKNWDTE